MVRSVVLVGEDLVEVGRWIGWLDKAGFLAVTCAGPRLRHDCPQTSGTTCLLRNAVDASVVAMPPHSVDVWGSRETSCMAPRHDGSTILIEGGRLIAAMDGTSRDLGPVTEQALVAALAAIRPQPVPPSR